MRLIALVEVTMLRLEKDYNMILGLTSPLRGLVEPLPISQRELIHQLPLGIIITDRTGSIVEMSDVAGNRLGVFEEFALGRSVDDVLAWCEPTPLRTSDLMRRGRPAGR